jgi:hypothetical protein
MAMARSFPTGDPAGLSIVDTRLVMAGLITRNADGSPRLGIFPGGNPILVTGRASMGYDIAPFAAAVSRTGSGVDLVANASTEVNVATAAAPGANSRIDVIWVRAQFTASSDAGNVPVFGVTQGTAGAVPTKPPIPAGAFELATAEIPSTATTTASVVIAQTAAFTAAAGGVVPFRKLVDLNAWTTARAGQYAQNLETGSLHVRGASSWLSTTVGIGMRRSGTATTIGAPPAYTNLSPNTFWTENFRDGFAAYANGITIPVSGVYRIAYTITTNTPILAGITVNKDSAVTYLDYQAPSSSVAAQGFSVAAASVEIPLLANQIIRLFAIPASGNPTWQTVAGLSAFQASFVRP